MNAINKYYPIGCCDLKRRVPINRGYLEIGRAHLIQNHRQCQLKRNEVTPANSRYDKERAYSPILILIFESVTAVGKWGSN